MPAADPPGFMPPHGNYRALFSYQKAEAICDITYRFCQRFLSKGDRTIDQMVQAARIGKQNIAEGNQAGGTSKETEIKLTGVARASLEDGPAGHQDAMKSRKPNQDPPVCRSGLFRVSCLSRPGEVPARFKQLVMPGGRNAPGLLSGQGVPGAARKPQ
jgi:hypothetical protein